MKDTIIIAVDSKCADIFFEFSKENPHDFLPVKHKSFIGSNEIIEFIVTITPSMLTALTGYLVARIQNSRQEIKIKKGDLEIELKNTNLTPETALNILMQLEQKPRQNEQR